MHSDNYANSEEKRLKNQALAKHGVMSEDRDKINISFLIGKD